jgi:hypothetical protein
MAQVQSASALMPATNPSLLSNPDYMQQMLQTQRTQALAQALTDQGLAPVEYDPRGRISPWQGVNKLASALLGGYEAQQAMKGQASLQSQAVQSNLQQYGAGQTPQTAPSPSQASQFALGQGAQAGSVGPTNDNARRLAAVLAPSQSAPAPGPAQAQGLPGAVAPVPANPYGISPDLMVRAQMGDPVAKVQLDNLLKNFEQTTEIKNNNWMGMTRQQALANANGKALKEAQLEYKPGEFTFNPISGQGGFFPSLPANTQPVGPVGPNGHVVGVSLVPGAPQAIQATSQAGATGTTAGTPHTITNSDGSTSTGLGTDVFQIPTAVQASRNADQLAILKQERLKPTNSPADNAALDREIARFGGGRVATGPSSTDAAVQKTNADVIASLPTQAAASKSAIGGLEAALNSLQRVNATGKGTVKTNDVIAAINNSLPASMQIRGDSNTQFQELSKFLSNSLNSAAAGTGASGSDARFSSFMHGQPNAQEMSKPALDSAIRYVLSQHDANVARSDFVSNAYQQAKAQGDPNAAQTAQAQWSKVYNPQLFAFSRMSPADRQQFKSSMTPAQQQAFGAQYNAAHERGWVQ